MMVLIITIMLYMVMISRKGRMMRWRNKIRFTMMIILGRDGRFFNISYSVRRVEERV